MPSIQFIALLLGLNFTYSCDHYIGLWDQSWAPSHTKNYVFLLFLLWQLHEWAVVSKDQSVSLNFTSEHHTSTTMLVWKTHSLWKNGPGEGGTVLSEGLSRVHEKNMLFRLMDLMDIFSKSKRKPSLQWKSFLRLEFSNKNSWPW